MNIEQLHCNDFQIPIYYFSNSRNLKHEYSPISWIALSLFFLAGESQEE